MHRKMSNMIMLGLFICAFSLLAVEDATAQNKRRNRGLRKPGEVITRPDRGEERWQNQLEVGKVAPEFTLPLLQQNNQRKAPTDKASATKKSADKKKEQTVSLHDLRAKQPVVLIIGSFTCPPFRNQLEGVDKVYDQFKDRAQFLLVYVREAHPDSILSVIGDNGREALQKIPQPKDLSTRVSNASICQRTKDLDIPIAVDKIDNRVGKAYAGWPNRMVVVGTDGRILFATDPSPRGTNARSLQDWLTDNLTKSDR
ncbi:MAG: redoxin domain-containing protein [Gimesia sp.]|nr:redoxin domain-containing protein [Gimesia sp.]